MAARELAEGAGMTREDIEKALDRAGLAVPARELGDVTAAVPLIEAMVRRLRRPRPVADEPAHVFMAAEP
jgi:hypothetical protein